MRDASDHLRCISFATRLPNGPALRNNRTGEFMTDSMLTALERLIRTDPARRGLIATEPEFGPLLPGHLALAARELADQATCVGIVTGFFIPSALPPAAETDGPLGAVLLAETQRQ